MDSDMQLQRHRQLWIDLSEYMAYQVRSLRRSHGWSRKDLARVSGVPLSRLTKIEQPDDTLADGPHDATLQDLAKLGNAFDVALVVRFAPWSGAGHAIYNMPRSFTEEYPEPETASEEGVPVDSSVEEGSE